LNQQKFVLLCTVAAKGYIAVLFMSPSMSVSGPSGNNDNSDHNEPNASKNQTDPNFVSELAREIERLSQQITAFFNRISGIEKQLSTLSKDIKGLHDDNLRSDKISLDQIHSDISNLQVHVKKIDKSINGAIGKIKLKKKEKKGKQKRKVKKKK
jgi:predicted transcriptional regulator